MVLRKRDLRANVTAVTAPPVFRNNMEPFSGCNCYYLLEQACNKQENLVKETLKEIKSLGFTVIRMWAFNEDPKKFKLHDRGVLNMDMMKRFDWLMDQVRAEGGLKLMMTLGNRLPNYGGMCAYVNWALEDEKKAPHPIADYDRLSWDEANSIANEFYGSDRAKKYYDDFVTNMVEYYKDSKYSDLIHSWDICNEPRYRFGDASVTAGWVHRVAELVKGKDQKHPVTVGSEGFFKNATKYAPGESNYAFNNNEGCDFIEEFKSPALDFACIHLYPDQWIKIEASDQPADIDAKKREWSRFSEKWVESHEEACKDLGMQLVLQEYGIRKVQKLDDGTIKADTMTERVKQLQMAKGLLQTSLSSKGGPGPLIGNMVWMVADEKYTSDDGYYIYPSRDSDAEIVTIMRSQSAAVQEAVTNKPASMAKAAKRLPTIIGDGPLLDRDGFVF